MDWQSLGGSLIRAGAPIIGTALGGPLGGMLGGSIGSVLAGALGTDDTAEAVDEAIKTMPAGELQAKLSAAEAEAVAKWPAIAEIAKAEAEASAAALAGIQETTRAEIVAGDPIQRWWRPVYSLELTIECAAVWIIIIYDVLWGEGKVANMLVQNASLLITYWSARFAVLGVYTAGRSWEKVEATKVDAPASGKLASSVIDQIVKAMRKR